MAEIRFVAVEDRSRRFLKRWPRSRGFGKRFTFSIGDVTGRGGVGGGVSGSVRGVRGIFNHLSRGLILFSKDLMTDTKLFKFRIMLISSTDSVLQFRNW